MEFKKENKEGAVKVIAEKDGNTLGRVYLYFIYNDLHKEPYGLLEDLYVEPDYRKQGLGGDLTKKAIEIAKEKGCYKILGTSRYARKEVHRFYKRLGFEDYGIEFRMEL